MHPLSHPHPHPLPLTPHPQMLHMCNCRGLLGHLGGAVKDLLTTTLVTMEPKPLPLGEKTENKAWSKSAQLGEQSLSESVRLSQTTGRVRTAEPRGGRDKVWTHSPLIFTYAHTSTHTHAHTLLMCACADNPFKHHHI